MNTITVLMKTKATIPHHEEILTAILSAEPSVNSVFLFGSRARENNINPHADIDLGVIAETKLTLVQLARIEEALARIPTLYSIDVVDFTDRDDEFTEEALRNRRDLN